MHIFPSFDLCSEMLSLPWTRLKISRYTLSLWSSISRYIEKKFKFELISERFSLANISDLKILKYKCVFLGHRSKWVSRHCAIDMSNDALHMSSLLKLQLLQHASKNYCPLSRSLQFINRISKKTLRSSIYLSGTLGVNFSFECTASLYIYIPL